MFLTSFRVNKYFIDISFQIAESLINYLYLKVIIIFVPLGKLECNYISIAWLLK